MYDPFTGSPFVGDAVRKIKRFSVADDDVAVILFPGTSGMVLVTEDGGYGEVMAFGRPAAPSLIAFNTQGGVYALTTGVLTGTTGVDTVTSLSVHTDGNLYLENRSGVVKNYVVTFLNIG